MTKKIFRDIINLEINILSCMWRKMEMQMYLFKLAQTLSKVLPMMGDTQDEYKTASWYTNIVAPIANALNVALGPILILLGSAGAIYAIVLGVNLSRAESSDKREEAKKRLINFVIGIVAAILLLVLLKLVVDNIDTIIAWITPDTIKSLPSASK